LAKCLTESSLLLITVLTIAETLGFIKSDMRTLLIAVILFGVNAFGHDLETNGLYKGYEVKDSSGNALRTKRQEFIKVNQNNLIRVQFQELLNMKTGDVIVAEKIYTITLDRLDPDLKFNQITKKSFELIYPEFILTFKFMENISEKSPMISECKDFLIGNTFIKNDIPKEEKPTLTYTYQENGLAKYQTIGSHSNWENPYSIIDFQGYVFLKGISSAPILITSLEKKRILGLAADYRFDPKQIEMIVQ